MSKRFSPSSVKTCWIAEVKRSLGFPVRPAWNRGQGKGAPPRPPNIRRAIQEVLRRSPGLTYREIQGEVARRLGR